MGTIIERRRRREETYEEGEEAVGRSPSGASDGPNKGLRSRAPRKAGSSDRLRPLGVSDSGRIAPHQGGEAEVPLGTVRATLALSLKQSDNDRHHSSDKG